MLTITVLIKSQLKTITQYYWSIKYWIDYLGRKFSQNWIYKMPIIGFILKKRINKKPLSKPNTATLNTMYYPLG